MKKISLMQYISTKIPIVFKEDKVFDIENYLKSNLYKFQEFDYIYVCDKDKKFTGFFPITELSKFPKSKTAFEISKNFKKVFIKEKDKKEYAAYLSLKYGFSSIPVVNSKDKLIGAIKDLDILKIIHKKHLEEVFHLSGISKSHAEVDSLFDISVFESIKHRSIWLLIGLIGGILAAEIIGFFEGILQENIILAAFIPLVVYIADAVGTQLEAFSIRDFVLIKNINFLKYFIKQIYIVFIISLVLGLASGLISYVMHSNIHLSIVLTISIMVAILSSVITGLIIPFIFRKLKKDPANGSGPIGTIIQDLLSVIVYFLVAKMFLI